MKKLISCFLILGVFLFIGFTLPSYAKDKQNPHQEETGSATYSSSFDAAVPPEDAAQLGGDVTASASCDWWWLTGQHHWRWSGIPYVSTSYWTDTKSWTEYGTSTGKCGIALTVDRLYADVVLKPSNYAGTSWTGYNTNVVYQERNGWCLGCAKLCGAKSFHQATKYGITWSVTTKSGCF